ncbi:hypothetical protein Tco_0990274 [Tanacetum coccineum]|uniref:Uncharacterized protein n=1 Tax=Tanacetum coccineum TaxID=301880 RepID=A0ABQ5EWA1_9ASTR
MANIRTCNKHNMIAYVVKTEHNADFHQIIDYLTGCSINYSLLVDPDLIGPWLQQFWATASLRLINEVPHIRAMVAGKKILISEETFELTIFDRCIWKHSLSSHVGLITQGTATYTVPGCIQSTGDTQESQNLKKKRKKQKKQKKKVSSVKLGRNKEEGTLSEEHYVQDDDTADPFVEDIVDKDAVVTPDIERKSDETEALERKKLDLETFQSTARQSTITPRTLNFEDEAGPSSPIRPTQNIEPEEQFKVDEVLAAISRPRALETSMLRRVARKIQVHGMQKKKGKGWDRLKKAKPKTTLFAQERNHDE